jgi:integrase
MTVGQVLDRWVSVSLPGHVADSTLDDYVDTVRLHLRPALGRRPLTKLSVTELNALWKAKRDQGYSANSVRIMRTVLRKALSQAERDGLLVRNVAALSTAPKVRAEPGQALSVEQARLLLRQLAGHRHEALVQLMLTYGLRRGEALGAQLVDLDLDDARLGLRAGVKRIKRRNGDGDRKTQLVVGDLKTARSRRTLLLTPPLVTSLRRHLARQAKERLAAGPAWRDHGLLFPSEVGTPLDPDNFSHWFTRLCDRAGLGHWHPHDLRHSGASLMLAQGVRLEVVSEILGHASIAITKDVYGHLVEGDKRNAASAMADALLGDIGSQNGSQKGWP